MLLLLYATRLGVARFILGIGLNGLAITFNRYK